MLCGVSVGPHRVVACGHHRLTSLVDNQGAKWMAAVITRFARQLYRLPQKSQVLFRYLFHCLALRF
jgi:hypothetical protein